MIGSFLCSIIHSVLRGSCVVLNLSAYPSFPNILGTDSTFGLDPPPHSACTSTTLNGLPEDLVHNHVESHHVYTTYYYSSNIASDQEQIF